MTAIPKADSPDFAEGNLAGTPTGHESPDSRRTMAFLFVCLFLVYGMFVVHKYEAYTFARYDPGWMVSTVMSIYEDGDLDLRNQLHNDPSQAGDQTSLGVRGEWYPLHEFLMPLASFPFYAAMGVNGCLVFNLVVTMLLMAVVFSLCARHVDPHSAFTATVLTAFPSLFLSYSYSYSLDVFSTLLLMLAYRYAVGHRYRLAGLLWGLAVFSRLAIAITAIGFLPFLLSAGLVPSTPGESDAARTRRFRKSGPLIRFLTGGIPVGICLLASNWVMFGSPLTTSYDRWQRFVDGHAVISSQRELFSCSPIDTLPAVLMDPKSGLLIGGPLIILALAFGMRSFWQKARSEAALVILISICLVVLYSTYCSTFPGSPGNRYLMPVVALCGIPLALAVADCFAHRK